MPPTCRPWCSMRLSNGRASTRTSSTTWSGDASRRWETNRAISAGTRCWQPAGPRHIPGTTVNRACGSSQQALDFAVQAVMSGQQDVVVAGGVEVMSRVPLGSARATGIPYGPKALARYAISRSTRASRRSSSRRSGPFHAAASMSTPRAPTSWRPRRRTPARSRRRSCRCSSTASPWWPTRGSGAGTTVEKLAGLKPAFNEDGVIHAGNSSQISDGAAALLVMTAENAISTGLDPDRPVSRRGGHRC